MPSFLAASSPLAPVPPSYTMATDESRVLPLDMTPLLEIAETVASATTSLTDKSVGRGEVITIPNPTVATPVVSQLLAGSHLTPGHVYWLRYVVTTSLGTVWTQILTINCPT